MGDIWDRYNVVFAVFFSFCRAARSKQTKAHISQLTEGRTDSTWIDLGPQAIVPVMTNTSH